MPPAYYTIRSSVRLGNSGLKISKIVLGCMTYGSPGWQGWVLEEEEAIKHIKFAYVRLPVGRKLSCLLTSSTAVGMTREYSHSTPLT